MAISAALQTRYTTETDQDWWQGVIISHPNISTVYLCDAEANQTGAVDGTNRTFLAIPFQIQLPRRDAEGRQDLTIVICAIGGEVRAHVDDAITDPTSPVVLRYGQWIRGDVTQQWDPLLSLNLTDILLADESVQCSATAADILNRPFPTALYRPSSFPGLDRR